MIGTMALRSTCLPMMLVSDRPPARSVLTKSWPRFSSMAERVIRTVSAMPSMASTTAGRISCFLLQHPAEGSQPSVDAKSHTVSRASQKLGTAIPATENVITEPSAQLLRLTAARMPNGTPMAKTNARRPQPPAPDCCGRAR